VSLLKLAILSFLLRSKLKVLRLTTRLSLTPFGNANICEVDFVDIAAENCDVIEGAYHLVRDRLSE